MLAITGAGEESANSGDLDITDDVTITGAGARNVIIDADRIDRIFDVREDVSVQISDLIIRNGLEQSFGWSITPGGAIRILAGPVTLTNVIVETSDGDDGGGIRNAAALILQSSTVLANTAGNDGGGISNTGTLTLTDSLVQGNAGEDGGGSPAPAGPRSP